MVKTPPTRTCAALLACAWLVSVPAAAADYEVGPGQDHASLGEVPWESLTAGDRVLVHHRADAYREKVVICARGTESDPVVVRGVPGPGGELPVLDGRDAVTRTALDYWNEERSLVKIGGASTPDCIDPSWIVVENLEVRSARPPYGFTGDGGDPSSYSDNAASVFVETGEHIVLRNLVVHDSGNGLFVAHAASHVTVESCEVRDNGVEGSIYQHNSYTSASHIVFQYNRYGHLREGCDGNNLKDRSAGTVIRYNWIEGGNRQLDLVDGAELSSHPDYGLTFVYGNVLVEHEGEGNSQVIHYGGDGGDTSHYRKGTLHLYNNTIVSTRSGNTTLLRLSTDDETADVRNNVVYVTADGSRLAMSNSRGTVELRSNWTRPGWQDSHSTLEGAVLDLGGHLTGEDPGFVDGGVGDYHLLAASACIDAGAALAPAALPSHVLLEQYVRHRGVEPRPVDGPLDVGAFETCATGDCSGSVDEVPESAPDRPFDSLTDVLADTAGDPLADPADVPFDAGGDTPDADGSAGGGSSGCGCTVTARRPTALPIVLLVALALLLPRGRGGDQ